MTSRCHRIRPTFTQKFCRLCYVVKIDGFCRLPKPKAPYTPKPNFLVVNDQFLQETFLSAKCFRFPAHPPHFCDRLRCGWRLKRDIRFLLQSDGTGKEPNAPWKLRISLSRRENENMIYTSIFFTANWHFPYSSPSARIQTTIPQNDKKHRYLQNTYNTVVKLSPFSIFSFLSHHARHTMSVQYRRPAFSASPSSG